MSKIRRYLASAAALGAVLASTLLVNTGGISAATATGMPKQRSFCVYSAQEVRQLREFEVLLGRSVDCASLFNTGVKTWAEWSNPWFTQTGYNPDFGWPGWLRADASRQIMVSQSMAPSAGMPADWLHRAALGQYNSYAVTLAKNLINVGMGASVIRLAPEANGYWNHDQVPGDAAGQADWRNAWINFVKAMRSVPGAHFTFDWCVNYRSWSHDRHHIELNDFYPGDAYVDMIGMDPYDENLTQASGRWWVLYNREFGIREMYAYAQLHRKPLSLAEWGMIPWGGPMQGGGDDPEYIKGIGQFVATHNVAYTGYWYTREALIILQSSPEGLGYLRQYFGMGNVARASTACASYCALAK